MQSSSLVIFHCRYSQCRAPSAATWVIEQLGGKVLVPNPRGSPSLERSMTGSQEQKPTNASNSSLASEGEEGDNFPFDVRVLKGGFEQWQEKFGGHPQLFESVHASPPL